MSRSKSFAKEEVMQEYLEGLLVDHSDPVVATQKVAKLLENATTTVLEQPNTTAVQERTNDVEPVLPKDVEEPTEIKEALTSAEKLDDDSAKVAFEPLAERLSERFQALFFDVAGLTMAVPLIDLGGIHQLEKVGPLFGKPDWFMGVMLHRDEKINVVDAAQWVMPEKYAQIQSDKLNYKYVIMLSESEWGLSSNSLINTIELNKSDVKWRQSDHKRPWLAGMVKERMCALIDVKQLIDLLNAGLNSNQK
ncbi:chemotaxis protein CheW [Alteromonas sp. ASW11-36]|uniref:Chemotaxis protein CheW n=1 Tax=Alteromonas arenosi TaxID=3055817 RepID=A0ABT7SV97_9ALTE|nr:chemotaxis protein CheW [Alteromonas sp. ASW11-36]MDM7860103.1 chemotaxis protein CheW [Alteromonas sp. ASW11-36]